MKPYILERKIGGDLALINATNQSVCILDEVGEQVWHFFQKTKSIDELKKRIEVPPTERANFELFCDELEKFLNGKVRDLSQGPSLHKYSYDKGIPLVIALEISTRCQLHCRHCYNSNRHSLEKEGKRYMNLPLSAVESLAKNLHELGTPFVIITGGEPLLHPQFLDICQILTSSGIALKVFTNGYNLTPQIADALVKMKIFLTGFTLFGSTAKDHEFISQVPGSFTRIVRAIKLIKERNAPTDVHFFLMQHNFEKRTDMAKWARNEFGINPSFSFSMIPRESGDLMPLELEINSQQMRTFFREEGVARESLQCGDETMTPCTAGKTLVAVKANGDVTPCISLIYPVGNIFENSFIDIWRNSKILKQFHSLKIHDIKGCSGCKLTNICLRCFVNAHILGKDIFGKDPHACKIVNNLQAVRDELKRRYR